MVRKRLSKEEREKQAQELRKLPYQEYLKTQYWLARRVFALKHAQNKCQICNSEGLLNVHHRTYERLGQEKQGDIIVLCNECHKLFHQHRKIERSDA